MKGLHVECQLIDVTKMCEGCMWRSIGNVTKKQKSYMCNVSRNSNLNFVKNSSTPWHSAVDQDWRSKMHVPQHANQLPDGSTLTVGPACPAGLARGS